MKRITGLVLLFLGLFLLFKPSITGAVVGLNLVDAANSVIGLIFILIGFLMFAGSGGLEKITLSSAIKKYEPILRLTKDAVKNQTIEKELNHLIKELSKGNFSSGIGQLGHIEGTDIFYLRGRKGGRLYYHKIEQNNYEIVAKSAKGKNQEQVISKLKEIYRH